MTIEVSTLGLAGAVAAGFVSFLSPCVLPLVPAYVSYVAGQSLHGTEPRIDARTRIHAGLMKGHRAGPLSTLRVALPPPAGAQLDTCRLRSCLSQEMYDYL